ncbi:glycosyltransferase [Stackebrandtia soli]|uniref:glycosyltransferase n=1 Tax=Stackebrandtia soli TaxID=1892856 RepID=UPI0039EB9CB9
MKVVIAHNRYSSAQPSGENSVVDRDIAQLTDAGVTVLPFLRDSDDIGALSPVGKAALVTSPIRNGSAKRELAELLTRERPDVLHLHNPYPLLSPSIIETAHEHGVPVVHTVHNFRQVCVNGLYFRDGHLCHDCRGRAFPTPAIVHACYRGSRAQSVVMATTLTVSRPLWRSVDRFIALTGDIAAHLRGYGIADEAITVKPNSIPDPGEHDVVGDGAVFVGRLSEEKGVDLLLDAWRRLPEGHAGTLTIVGDGPLAPRVAEFADRRGDVVYRGPLPHDAVTEAIRAAAFLVTTSLCADVLPTVVIEALANARPVLTTNLGGPPHMIGDAGLAVTADAGAVADGLTALRADAPALTEVARARYLAEFAPGIGLERQLAVYEEVSAAARRAR